MFWCDWLNGKNIPRDTPHKPERGCSVDRDIIGSAKLGVSAGTCLASPECGTIPAVEGNQCSRQQSYNNWSIPDIKRPRTLTRLATASSPTSGPASQVTQIKE